jgi:hypothetical protein
MATALTLRRATHCRRRPQQPALALHLRCTPSCTDHANQTPSISVHPGSSDHRNRCSLEHAARTCFAVSNKEFPRRIVVGDVSVIHPAAAIYAGGAASPAEMV